MQFKVHQCPEVKRNYFRPQPASLLTFWNHNWRT